MRNCIGIDIAKKQFDMHLLKQNKDVQLANDADGISKCVQLCREAKPELIVMEATGGYEALLAGHLQAEGFAVAVVNPRRIRDFARAVGQIAKTDKLDARIIAQFADTLEPMPQERIDDNSRKLKALVARRKQLLDMRVAESNRMEHAIDKEVKRSIEAIVKAVESQINKIDRKLQGLNSVAVIGLQKPLGRDTAFGGDQTLKNATLYIAMDSKKLKIVDAKVPATKTVHPKNMQWTFSYEDEGTKFTQVMPYHGD